MYVCDLSTRNFNPSLNSELKTPIEILNLLQATNNFLANIWIIHYSKIL